MFVRHVQKNKTDMIFKLYAFLLIIILLAITPIASAANLNTPSYTVQPVITDIGDVITRGEIYGTVNKNDLLSYNGIRIELTLESEGVQFINFRKQPYPPKIYRNKAIFEIMNPQNYSVSEWSVGLHITDPTVKEIQYTTTISVNNSGIYERVYATSGALIIVAHSNRDAKEDSDGDMLIDDEERVLGTDPYNPDTNDDGILDSIDADYRNKRNIEDISIDIRGTKTTVEEGEDVILTLSAINLITKPKMALQVILTVPSGMSVSSMNFVKSGSGQYTADFEVGSGQSRFIEVRANTNQEGSYTIHGKLIYYFEGNKSTAKYEELKLPITVNQKKNTDTPIQNDSKLPKTTPGFSTLGFTIGIITSFIILYRKS